MGVDRASRGWQLLQEACDRVVAGDPGSARTLLCEIDVEYFTADLPLQAARDSEVASALAVLVEVFGADLVLVLRPVGLA